MFAKPPRALAKEDRMETRWISRCPVRKGLARAFALSSVLFVSACSGAGGEPGEAVGHSSSAVTVCAAGATLKGVDVSEYQGSVDWSAVAASGLSFAITRVSDGTDTLDPYFAANWSGIKAAGMVRGVYQFFRASQDPTAQADLLVTQVGTLDSGDLSPVADVEVLDGESGATLVANLATWVSVIESKTGRTPMIYASPGFWDDLPSTGQFSGLGSWVADWGPTCPDTSTPWTNWQFWQYADNGTVSGISGAVDVDEFNGTLAELQQLGGGAPYAAQYVSQSFPLATTALTMTEGQTIPSYIELKNVGSKTWDTNTHIGTTQPRDRDSVFADSSWLGPNRPAGVTGTVAPGGTFKFQFDLHAPNAPGNYKEYFGVVEDGVAWFSDPGQGGPPDNDLEVQINVIAAEYQGTFKDQSYPLAPAPETVHVGTVTRGYIELTNTGTKPWVAGVTKLAPVPRDEACPLADASWLSPTRVSTVDADVAVGAVGRFALALDASQVGDYEQEFGLVEEAVTWFADAPLGGGPADGFLKVHLVVVPAGASLGPGIAPFADGGAGKTPRAGDSGSKDGSNGSGDASSGSHASGCSVGRTDGGGSAWVPLGIVGVAVSVWRRRRQSVDRLRPHA
jgi:lysozyme